MRNRILFPLTLSLLLPPGLVLAQEEGEDTMEEEGASETRGQDVLPSQVQTDPTAGGRQTAPGEVHTVTRGDTLWDLSQRYLGNSWYWPKVWSYNPEIANPHWIYPGNRVRFFPDGDETPTQVETGEGPQGVSELEGVEPGTEFATDEVDDTVQVAGKIGPTLHRESMVIRDVFVTPREVEEAGVIEAAFSEANMLTFMDEMYVRFNQGGGRIGDRYLIFRTEQAIDHPRKFGRVGFMTRILGTAQIVRVSDRVSTMRIDQAWDEIRRGDLIGPYGERLNDRLASRPADRKLEGFVVAGANPHLTMMGEYHTIVLDKGSSDGVQRGFEFVVTRKGDFGGKFTRPYEVEGRQDYPWEDIAVCMAVDVKETASTCLIKRSLREIVPGDRVETRPEAGGALSQR